jgi:uncharacterized phiE125 gp8 family phage protein
MVTNVQYTALPTATVTLAQAKKHLRIEDSFTDEDELIQAYIDAAIENCENFTGGSIINKTMVMTMDAFDSPVLFEAFPLREITTVEYLAKETNAVVVLPVEKYRLTTQNAKCFSLRFLNDLPEIAKNIEAVTVTVDLGYATIPKPIIQAIKLQIADMYERREDRSESITTASAALLRPYKKY